jgi:hypothetical protein
MEIGKQLPRLLTRNLRKRSERALLSNSAYLLIACNAGSDRFFWGGGGEGQGSRAKGPVGMTTPGRSVPRHNQPEGYTKSNCVGFLCSIFSWVHLSSTQRPPGREDAVGKERVRSTPMPEPFSAIRDVAASRRRALGAQARTSVNGRGIDVLRGSAAVGSWRPAPS